VVTYSQYGPQRVIEFDVVTTTVSEYPARFDHPEEPQCVPPQIYVQSVYNAKSPLFKVLLHDADTGKIRQARTSRQRINLK